jgi:hypothetical protein
MDRDRLESSAMCGACHDVVTPANVKLEQTFAQWQASVFSHAPGGSTCGQCHMPQSGQLRPAAQVESAPLRRVHSHLTPGIDVPAEGHPQRSKAIAAAQKLLDTSIQSALCVGPGRIRVILDNVAAGHDFPSGAALDRRVWVEVKAYAQDQLVYQSGAELPSDASLAVDPDLWLMRDCGFDAQGKPAHMFWDVLTMLSATLEGAQTFDPADPRFYQTHIQALYPETTALPAQPDRVTMRVRMQPIARETLDDLVKSGDLDAAVRDHALEWQVGETLEWTPQSGKLLTKDGVPWSCCSLTNLDSASDTVMAIRRCDKPSLTGK